jgi:hypothetical protein
MEEMYLAAFQRYDENGNGIISYSQVPLKGILVTYLLHALPQGNISKGELRQMLEELGEGYVRFFSHSLYVFCEFIENDSHIFQTTNFSFIPRTLPN